MTEAPAQEVRFGGSQRAKGREGTRQAAPEALRQRRAEIQADFADDETGFKIPEGA